MASVMSLVPRSGRADPQLSCSSSNFLRSTMRLYEFTMAFMFSYHLTIRFSESTIRSHFRISTLRRKRFDQRVGCNALMAVVDHECFGGGLMGWVTILQKRLVVLICFLVSSLSFVAV